MIIPGDIKFKAIVNGKEIKNGDFWHPFIENPSIDNCYGVKISNLGIHYCKKILNDNQVVLHDGGLVKRYYLDFENEQLYTDGVELILIDDK